MPIARRDHVRLVARRARPRRPRATRAGGGDRARSSRSRASQKPPRNEQQIDPDRAATAQPSDEPIIAIIPAARNQASASASASLPGPRAIAELALGLGAR